MVYALTSANADPQIGGTGVTVVPAGAGGTGVFTVPVTGLTAGSAYSFRAYATNSEGTSYAAVATVATPSTTTTLSALTLSAGTLSPSFASGTTSYTASVANATSSLTVTPTVTQAQATVGVRVGTSGSYTAVTSGSASGALALAVGANTIEVLVTAQDGVATQLYTVTVTRRAAPTVASPTSTAITATGATLGGTVTADGGATVTARGVVYALTSANADPQIGGTAVTMVLAGAGGTGVFTVPVTGLTAGSTYSFRAYATNSEGTSYAAVASFATPSTVTTLSALTLSAGTLSPSFASGTTSYTASVANATSSLTVTPTVTQAQATVGVRVGGSGAFTAVTSGTASGALALAVGANTIEVLVTAQDGVATQTYTVTVTRAAGASVPTVGSPTSTAITATGATLGGSVTADGGATVTARGVVYALTSANADPQIGGTDVTVVPAGAGGTGTFTLPVTGLTAGSVYSFRAYATNSEGTSYAAVATFATPSTTTTLSALVLSAGTLSPGFASGTTSYTASVANATSSLTVTPTVTQAQATVGVRVGGSGSYTAVTSGTASGALALVVGANTIEVLVTAQDGVATQTYTVTVTREGGAQTLTDYDGTGPAPTLDDYTAAGVTGVTSGNLTAFNTVLAARPSSSRTTSAAVQAMVDAYLGVLASAGTGPAASLAQFQILGQTGVTADNLPAMQQALADGANDGSDVDTYAELSAVVQAAVQQSATAVAQLSTWSGEGVAPSSDTYRQAGVLGVTPDNLAAMNSAVAIRPTEATNTVAGLQQVVTAYLTILSESNGDAADVTPDASPAAADYAALGATTAAGLSTGGLALLNDVVGRSTAAQVGTVAQIDTMAGTVSRLFAVAAGSAVSLTVDDFALLGITGVNATRLSFVRAAVAASDDLGTGVQSLALLQALVDSTAATGVTISGPATSVAGVAVTLSIRVVDAQGRDAVLTASTSFRLSSDDSGATFGTGPALTLPPGTSTSSVTYVSARGGVHTIRLTWMQADGTTEMPGRTSGLHTLTADRRTQTITFIAPAPQGAGGEPLPLSASASSGLPVSFEALTPGVCTVSNGAVRLLTAGTCTVRASQSGNDVWLAATSVDRSLLVIGSSVTLERTTSTLPSTGGSDEVAVTVTPSTLLWRAVSSAEWVSTTSTGTGSGRVAITVAPNLTASARSATVAVGPATLVVTQEARPQLSLRVVDVRQRRVTLQWTYSGPTTAGFVLEGDVVRGGRAAVLPAGRETMFTLEVPPGHFYVRVRTQEDLSGQWISNEVDLLVEQPMPPSAPSSLVAGVEGRRVSLNWTNTFEGGEPTGLALVVTGSINGTFSLPLSENLTIDDVPDGTYTMRLVASNASGTSPASAAVTVSVPSGCTLPQAPSWVTAARNGAQVTLRWEPPASGGAATGYVVTAEGLGSVPVGMARTVSGVLPAGTYRLWVQSVNSCGTSLPSAVQVVTVP